MLNQRNENERESLFFSDQFTHKLHLLYLVNDVLHHCLRKGPENLLRSLEQAAVQMFANASIAAVDEEQKAKLAKLLSLWQSKGTLFERGILDRLSQGPLHIWNEYQASLATRYAPAIAVAINGIQHTYENYRGQHQAFVNHAGHQIQQLEQQKLQIEDQIAQATAHTPYGGPPPHHQPIPVAAADFSRPPPIPSAAHNFPAEGIEPKAPYFDLPAGLLVPLVKAEDSEYKSIDPKDIRLPAPLPPSERLIAAIDFFYAPPTHDRPRNADGSVFF